MTVYQTHSVQIWPRNKFQADVRPCGDDKWLRIYGDEEEICAYLIVGATNAEMNNIANAFNAPHVRMARENEEMMALADKLSAKFEPANELANAAE